MPQLSRSATILLLMISLVSPTSGEEFAGVSKSYKALKFFPPSFGTWAVLDRDGANRQVDPYLSSLAGSEFGTGTISSPEFTVAVDSIAFTICGHDGQGGGQGKNLIALVDARSGEVLRKTLAPGSDSVQPQSWDVQDIRGRAVRIEVRDGISAGGFAWLGIGKVDAGPRLSVDFRKGLPAGWRASAPPLEASTDLVKGGIPFRALRQSMIPMTGAAEVACGTPAKRLFLLGCTVGRGYPLQIHGTVEVVYREGPSERFPLMVGFTLEDEQKLLSRSKAIHLHASGDPFQYYLVIAPRPGVVEKVRLEKSPTAQGAPFISAITVELEAGAGAAGATGAPGSSGEALGDLPNCRPSVGESAWIDGHAISATSPRMAGIEAEIRKANKM